MAQKYMVVNRHEPDYCEPMEAALTHLPDHLVGQELFCPCPYGEHGYYMILEGESSEAVIEMHPQHQRMVLVEAPDERLAQLADLGPHPGHRPRRACGDAGRRGWPEPKSNCRPIHC